MASRDFIAIIYDSCDKVSKQCFRLRCEESEAYRRAKDSRLSTVGDDRELLSEAGSKRNPIGNRALLRTVDVFSSSAVMELRFKLFRNEV